MALKAPRTLPRDGVRELVVDELRWDARRVDGRIRVGAAAYPVYFAAAGAPARQDADALLAIALLPAMVLGAELRIEGPVSRGALEAAGRVQAQLTRWFGALREVRVSAARSLPDEPPPRGVATLFSGGVDSFYSVLAERERLTQLVFVHGFDVPLADQALRLRVAESLRAAAAELGLPLVEVETDARTFTDAFVPWELVHGAALVAAAMTVKTVVGELAVPSSGEWLSTWGSHPELDPLWSTPGLRIAHPAAEVTRQAKLRRLAQSDTALRHLRVCWINTAGAYNCGRCEKCVRTMTGLRVAGAGALSRTFPPLELGVVRRVAISRSNAQFWQELERGARDAGDERLSAAIRLALRLRPVRALVDPLRGPARRIPGLAPAFRLVRDRLWRR